MTDKTQEALKALEEIRSFIEGIEGHGYGGTSEYDGLKPLIETIRTALSNTYDPATNILVAREDVPSVDNLREAVVHMEQYEIAENRMQKWGWYLRYIIDAAALLAQKTVGEINERDTGSN